MLLLGVGNVKMNLHGMKTLSERVKIERKISGDAVVATCQSQGDPAPRHALLYGVSFSKWSIISSMNIKLSCRTLEIETINSEFTMCLFIVGRGRNSRPAQGFTLDRSTDYHRGDKLYTLSTHPIS